MDSPGTFHVCTPHLRYEHQVTTVHITDPSFTNSHVQPLPQGTALDFDHLVPAWDPLTMAHLPINLLSTALPAYQLGSEPTHCLGAICRKAIRSLSFQSLPPSKAEILTRYSQDLVALTQD